MFIILTHCSRVHQDRNRRPVSVLNKKCSGVKVLKFENFPRISMKAVLPEPVNYNREM